MNLLRYISALCFLLSAVCCLANSDSLTTDTTHLPEKWKKESVVILNYEYSFSYEFSYYSVPSKKTSIHIVYYVRDKWGVEELSRISLPAGVDGAIDQDKIGTVFKRNGNKVEISKDQLIPRKESVNFNRASGRRGLSLESEIDQKLAVPSLEIGDILEINIVTSNSNPPEYILLLNKFPMQHFHVSVSISQPYSYGASVVIDALYINKKEWDPYAKSVADTTQNKVINVFGTSDEQTKGEYHGTDLKIDLDFVDKYRDEILNDTRKDLPYVLMRYRVQGGVVKKGDFSDRDIMNLNSNEDIHLYLARQIYQKKNYGEKAVAKKILGALSKKYPVIKDTVAYIKDAYYMYREIIASDNLYNGYSSYEYKGDRFYACVLSRVLFEKRIKYKLFLSQPDHYPLAASYDKFIEPTFGIWIPGKDLYLFNPLYSHDPENIPQYFEGQKYYSFSANKHYKKTKYFYYFWLLPIPFPIPAPFAPGLVTAPITIPIFAAQNATAKKYRKFDLAIEQFPQVQPENNRVVNEVNVKKIDLKDKVVLCETRSSNFGKMKIQEAERICSASNFFLKDKNEYRKMASSSPLYFNISEFDTLHLSKRMRTLAENDLYRDGFLLKKLISHKLVEPNFFDASKPFIFSVEYEAKNLVTIFDDYVVFNAGNFIGKQLAVPDQAGDRENRFYIPFSKQLVNKISIQIPEGYAVENLNDFNLKKESPAGSFASQASVSGSTVMITTTKEYRFHSLDKKDAFDVYPFLAEAEKFYDKKMIFKKMPDK